MGVEQWKGDVSTPTLALPLQGGGDISANGLSGLKEYHGPFLHQQYIDFSVIHDTNIHSNRHSGEGRNPANKITPRSGHSHVLDVAPLRGYLENCLDSGLCRNDGVAGLGVVANYGNLNNYRFTKNGIIHRLRPLSMRAGLMSDNFRQLFSLIHRK